MSTEPAARLVGVPLPDAYLTAKQVGRLLHVSAWTARTYLRDGLLPGIRLTPRGPWLISRSALDAHLASLSTGPKAGPSPTRVVPIGRYSASEEQHHEYVRIFDDDTATWRLPAIDVPVGARTRQRARPARGGSGNAASPSAAGNRLGLARP